MLIFAMLLACHLGQFLESDTKCRASYSSEIVALKRRHKTEKPPDTCMPLARLKEDVDKSAGAFSHLRQAADQEMALLAFHHFYDGPTQDWDRIMLLDTPDGGLLLAGYSDRICAFAVIPDDDWFSVEHNIEGDKA